MKYIVNNCTNPYYNLAFEEYILDKFTDDEYVFFWQNDNAIIIGKNQNALAEVNLSAAEEAGVKIVRRETGGGAVYHDLGNLNFSYISDWEADSGMNYDHFLRPVIHALNELGVKAYKQGRNDIAVGECKISGNAQRVSKGRILHHGTILINSDLSMLSRVLTPREEKFTSKGIKSVRSRVANVSELTDMRIDISTMKELLKKSFFQESNAEELMLEPSHLENIERMAREKYSTWNWNFGSSPKSNYKSIKKFPGGTIEVNLSIGDSGVIEDCRIFGDFLALSPIEPIEKALTGRKFTGEEIRGVLSGFDLQLCFGSISFDEILQCFEP